MPREEVNHEEEQELDDVSEADLDQEEADATEEDKPDAREETDEEEEADEAGGDQNDEDDDEVIVTVGDEAPAQEDEDERTAPKWVKELRKAHREMVRENRELKQKLVKREEPAQEPRLDPGPKPKLDDFDYDSDEFDKALSSWYEKKGQADAQAKRLEAEQKEQHKSWQARLDTYGQAKSKLKVRDFDDAETVVLDSLNQTQQGIILQGADNPALVVYALGKNPDRAKQFSSINDPVKFAFAVAKLEKDLKVAPRKTPPTPERKVTGTAPKSGALDSTLDRLRADAEKTGDYSKVAQYRRQKRAKK